ncbi:FKBP-type peptidyl-prolyl cis-trans isomerase [Maribacter sp. 2210JD10-5]|uniref:FKBP-type peptidyl-prolyl cis-trans isomerase n=1 Tax=Maribacter sp. 2210JD10-5 TaxID=3386272 RepID=UPI0039BD338D
MYLAALKAMLMKLKNSAVIAFLAILIISCKNDDEGPDIEVVPPRVLSEVAAEDDAEIREYLETHFYNYEEFASPPADFDFNIVIDTISGDNSSKIPLINQIIEKKVIVSSSEFLLEGEENVEHTYYYLEAKGGVGAKPTIADSTFVKYEGTLLNGDVFDNISTGVWWDNPSFQFPGPGNQRAFRGVGEGVTNTAGGNNIIDNPDGTFEVEGFGVGMIVFPSALGTFNGLRNPIPAYSPLIFKYQVLTSTENTDHDNDGIPSLFEDSDEDGLLYNDNADFESEPINGRFPNYLDADDDNDGIPTREEINLDENGNFLSFRFTNGGDVPDHLNSDI